MKTYGGFVELDVHTGVANLPQNICAVCLTEQFHPGFEKVTDGEMNLVQ